MKKVVVILMASLGVLSALSLGGCAGKSPKAPPPPVVTKG
jgi:hypothetical protein